MVDVILVGIDSNVLIMFEVIDFFVRDGIILYGLFYLLKGKFNNVLLVIDVYGGFIV